MGELGLTSVDRSSLRQVAAQVRELRCRGDVRCFNAFTVTRKEIDEAVHPVCERMWREVQRCVVKAILDKTINGHRYGYYLVRIGGGSRFSPMAGILESTLMAGWPQCFPKTLELDLNDRLVVRDKNQVHPLRPEMAHLFFVAHGLTTHYVRLPEPWLPSEIEDIQRERRVDPVYVRDDDT